MKRDMNLIRKIMLEVESWPTEKGGSDVSVAGYDPGAISYHVMLLDEAGLIHGIDASAGSDTTWYVDRLTWAGHEFVEAARDDTRWNKALGTISDKGGAFIFEVIKQLLVQLAKDAVFGSH